MFNSHNSVFTIVSQKYGEMTVISGYIQLKEGFMQAVQHSSVTPITEITGNNAFGIQHKREIYQHFLNTFNLKRLPYRSFNGFQSHPLLKLLGILPLKYNIRGKKSMKPVEIQLK